MLAILIFIGLAGLAAVTPLVIVPGLFEPAMMPQTAVLQIGALVLLGLSAFNIDRRGFFAPSSIRPAVALLLAWSALSLIWAHNRHEAGMALGDWAAAALVYLVAAWRLRGERDVRGVLLAVFVAAVAAAGLGLAQFFFNVGIVPQGFPPASTFMNKNLAAEFVVIALPFGMLGARRRPARRLALCAGGAVIVAYLLVSFSRAAWLALALQSVFAIVISRRNHGNHGDTIPKRGHDPNSTARTPNSDHVPDRSRVVAIALAIVVALGLIATAGRAVNPRLGVSAIGHVLAPLEAGKRCFSGEQTRAPANASVMSVCTRIAIWRNTLVMAANKPLTGFGLGNHRVFYPLYAHAAVKDPMYGEHRQLRRAHNEPLEILAELGIPGLALAAWLAVLITLGLLGALKRAGRSFTAPALTLAWIAVAVALLFGFPLRMPATLILVAVLLAAVETLGASAGEAGEARAGQRTRSAMRALVVILVLPGLVAAVPRHARRISGDIHVFRAMKALNTGDWTTAEREAAGAIARDPKRREALYGRGSALIHLKRPGEAVAMLKTIEQGYPYDLNTLGNLAAAHAMQGSWTDAEMTYERVIALEPEGAATHASLAVVLERSGNMRKALEERRLAAEHEPERVEYHYNYATLAFRLGRFDEAEGALHETLKRRPDWAIANKTLGILLHEYSGRKEEGARFIRRALELNPQISDADRMRKLLNAKTP